MAAQRTEQKNGEIKDDDSIASTSPRSQASDRVKGGPEDFEEMKEDSTYTIILYTDCKKVASKCQYNI